MTRRWQCESCCVLDKCRASVRRGGEYYRRECEYPQVAETHKTSASQLIDQFIENNDRFTLQDLTDIGIGYGAALYQVKHRVELGRLGEIRYRRNEPRVYVRVE